MNPCYAILRFEKHQGNPARKIENHHERNKERYASNPDVDTARSKDNFHIIEPAGRYYAEIQRRIEAAGCKTRRDSVRFIDTLITASPEFFAGKSKREIRSFFAEACAFLESRVGRENIISAVVHMDEKTPHMHLVFVPLTADRRLCAKEIIGNRRKLTQWQDDFWSHMVSRFPDLERGESASATGRDHIPTRVYKEAAHLSHQASQIEALLGSMTPFNAKRTGEKAAAMLAAFFPRMERLQTQLKKYDSRFKELKAENRQLADAATVRVHERLEDAKLRADYANLRRMVKRIPPEILSAAYKHAPQQETIGNKECD